MKDRTLAAARIAHVAPGAEGSKIGSLTTT
jgi:hypothetical protein